MKVFISSAIFVFCLVMSPLGAAVDLDSSFGDGGVVRPEFPALPSPEVAGRGRCVLEQPDGKVLQAGRTNVDGELEVFLVRHLADGSLDASFGTNGLALLRRADSEEFPTSLRLLPDGSILVAGWSNAGAGSDMLLARFLADGTLDPSFGSAGVTLLDAGGEEEAHGLTLDLTGRILLVGSSSSGAGDLMVARFLANGVLDGTFGSAGWVTASLGPSYEEGRDIAVLSDGRILACGFSRLSGNDAFLLCRFLEDGTLDESLNGIGRLGTQVTTQEDRAQSMLVQSDGKIVLGGWSTAGDRNFALVRYNLDGSLDGTFGAGGIVSTDFGGSDDLAYSVLPDGAGGFFVGGTSFGLRAQYAAARYSSAGALVTGFGTAGQVTVPLTGLDAEATGMALLADGGLLLGASVTGPGVSDLGLCRLDAAGSLSPVLDGDGLLETDLGLTQPFSLGRAIQVLPGGGFLAGGSVQAANGNYQFVAARYLEDGSFDGSFGSGGRAIASLGAESDLVFSMAVQADGKVVLAGRSDLGGIPRPGLARFLESGQPDPAFGSGGVVVPAVGHPDVGSEMWAVEVYSGGGLIGVGYAAPGALDDLDLAITKFADNGALDPTFGTGGAVLLEGAGTGWADIATGVVVQDDGKVVVAGFSQPSNGSDWRVVVVRLLASGQLDPTFGTSGKTVVTWPGGNAFPRKLLLQPDGQVLICGTADAFGSGNFACTRLLASGAVDAGFGVGGTAVVSLGGASEDCLSGCLDSMGRVLLTGVVDSRFALLRLGGDGVLDTAFGDGGSKLWDFPEGGAIAYDVAIASDHEFLQIGGAGGRMVVARSVETLPNQDPVAMNDVWHAMPGGSVLIPVLENDDDPNTDPLAILSVTQPVSGGTVVIEASQIRFNASGNFSGTTFTYEVTDGRGGTDSATVTMGTVSLFSEWRMAWFGAQYADPLLGGELRDPDLDGILNLLEYAFGLNPLVAEEAAAVTSRVEGGRLVLTVPRWMEATDLTVVGEFCEDLSSWSTDGVTVMEVSNDGFIAEDEYRGPLPLDGRQFGQIEVTK